MVDTVKIAVLFRGPVRPNPNAVVHRVQEFLSQFANANVEIHTYLATWRYWKQYKASDLLNLDLFDNVIMQTEPTDAQRHRWIQQEKLPKGADVRPVWNMYYQSKTALDIIMNSDSYQYIVHSRTDMQMIMNEHIPEWFDPNYYVAPHVPGVFAPHAPHIPAEDLWMCDQFGVASAKHMHAAWNYGDLENLGRMIAAADIPERVLERMIAAAGIAVRTAPSKVWLLDPARNA